MKIDYYAYHSKMKHWNAGFKVLLAVGTLFLTIGLDRLSVSLAVILAMSWLTLKIGKIPWKIYLHMMAVPLTFMILSGLAIACSFSGKPVGTWNLHLVFFWICCTKSSIRTAVLVFVKAMAGMSALYMLSLSTPANEIILVLQKLHLPHLLVELMHLIYRYLFILLDVSSKLQTAVKARLGDCDFIHACKSFAGIAGNLFLISLKKGNSYYDALLARGYDGKLEFLTEESPVAKGQIALMIVFFAVLLLLGMAEGAGLWKLIF